MGLATTTEILNIQSDKKCSNSESKDKPVKLVLRVPGRHFRQRLHLPLVVETTTEQQAIRCQEESVMTGRSRNNLVSREPQRHHLQENKSNKKTKQDTISQKYLSGKVLIAV